MPDFTPSTDPAFPPYPEPPYTQTHDNGRKVQVSWQDANGRYWLMYQNPDGTLIDLWTTDSGDPNDLTEWREAEPHEYAEQGFIGRSYMELQGSPPLEETTPFGPQEPPAPEPDYDPWDQPREGHWDPAKLQWVYDEPTMKSAEILDDDHTHTLGESRPETSSVGKVLGETPWDQSRGDVDSSSSSVGKVLDDTAPTTEESIQDILGTGAPQGWESPLPTDPEPPTPRDSWDQPREGQPTTRSGGILDDTAPTTEEGGAGGSAEGEGGLSAPLVDEPPGPWDQPREGHWDPAALRFVYDEPETSSVGRVLDDGHTGTRGESRPAADEDSSDDGHTDARGESRPAADQEGSAADLKADLGEEVAGPLRSGHWDPAALRFVYDEPETSSVGRVLDDESTQDTGEGGAGGGVDPSAPFDPDTTPTSAEGTTAAPINVDSINVDSTSFEGSATQGVDPSVPLDRADPNLTEEPAHPEPGTPGHDDHDDPLDLG